MSEWQTDLVGGVLVAPVLVATGLYSALSIVRRGFPDAPASVRWCAVGIVWVWLLQATFHLLAAEGWFTPLPALATWVGLSATARTLLDRDGGTRRTLTSDLGALAHRVGQALRVPERALYGSAVVVVALTEARGLLMPPASWDGLTYHLFEAGLWVQKGSLAHVRAPDAWGYYSYFPAGVEVLQAWFMLPFHGDVAVNLTNLPLSGLAVVALFALGRTLGLRARSAAAAGLLLAFTPALFTYVITAYVDIGTLAALLAATLFLARASLHRKASDVLLGLVSLGIAASVKALALPLVAVGALVGAAAAWRARRGTTAWLLGAGAAAAVALPFYGRAALDHGNPLYPLELRLFGSALLKGSTALRVAIAGSGPPAGDLLTRLSADMWQQLGLALPLPMRFGPALLFVVALAVPGWRLLRRTGRRAADTAGLLALVGVALYLSPAVTPMRRHWPEVAARFALFPYALGLLPLLAVVENVGRSARGRLTVLASHRSRCPPRPQEIGLAAVLALAATGIATGAAPVSISAALPSAIEAATLGLVLLLWWRGSRQPPASGHRRPIAPPAVALILCAVALVAARDAVRYPAYRNYYEIHALVQLPVDTWELLDTPATPRRIAVTAGYDRGRSGHNWFWYPLLGRRLQNEVTYVPITADGSIIDYREEDRVAAVANRSAWLRRLADQEIDVVVNLPPDAPEEAWMVDLPGVFEPLLKGRVYSVDRGAARRLSAEGQPR